MRFKSYKIISLRYITCTVLQAFCWHDCKVNFIQSFHRNLSRCPQRPSDGLNLPWPIYLIQYTGVCRLVWIQVIWGPVDDVLHRKFDKYQGIVVTMLFLQSTGSDNALLCNYLAAITGIQGVNSSLWFPISQSKSGNILSADGLILSSYSN